MTRPGYPSLFWSYFRIGATAFGGGLAALPVFEAELVNRRHWLAPAEVVEAYAISQSIPGVIVINFAIYTALRIAGKRAAMLAAITVALPAFFIILALAAFFGERWDNRWVNGALAGLRPAVIALIAGAAIHLGRDGFRSPLFLLGSAVSAVLMLKDVLSPVPLILIGAAAGVALHVFRHRKKASL